MIAIEHIRAALAREESAADARNRDDEDCPAARHCPRCADLRALAECIELAHQCGTKGWEEEARAMRFCADILTSRLAPILEDQP